MEMRIMSDLNISQEKMSDFDSSPFFRFSLFIKVNSFDFVSHQNLLIFFDKKEMTSDLNVFHGKMFHFFSFSLFGLTLVIKQRNFDFKNH